MGATPRTRIHVPVSWARRAEFDSAHRAHVRRGRHARAALGTQEGDRRGVGESHAADARGRRFRDEAPTGRTLIQRKRALIASNRLPGGIGEIADLPQVRDDFGKRSTARLHDPLRRGKGFVGRNKTGTVGASRAPREGGPAVLAPVDFEGCEPPALPTKDLRHRPERFHETVELMPGFPIGVSLSLLGRRITLRWNAAADRAFPPIHVGQDLHGVIIKSESPPDGRPPSVPRIL